MNEAEDTPFLYRKGALASSIEGSAYALMLLLKYRKIINSNGDKIADWLNAQRNHKGAFVGAMVSA